MERVDTDGRPRADGKGYPRQFGPDDAIAAGDDRRERPERGLGKELPEPLLLCRALARVLVRGAAHQDARKRATEEERLG